MQLSRPCAPGVFLCRLATDGLVVDDLFNCSQILSCVSVHSTKNFTENLHGRGVENIMGPTQPKVSAK